MVHCTPGYNTRPRTRCSYPCVECAPVPPRCSPRLSLVAKLSNNGKPTQSNHCIEMATRTAVAATCQFPLLTTCRRLIIVAHSCLSIRLPTCAPSLLHFLRTSGSSSSVHVHEEGQLLVALPRKAAEDSTTNTIGAHDFTAARSQTGRRCRPMRRRACRPQHRADPGPT